MQKIYSRTILKTKGSLSRKIQSGRGTMKKVIYCALCVIAGAAAALLLCRFSAAVKCEKKEKTAVPRSAEPAEKTCRKSGEKIITGYGYIRGRSCTTLRNKYGAYVSKVHFYSDRPVKKGDCILEYDDFDLRQKIVAAENAIANLEKELALQRTKLELTKLDPLPSDYRNLSLKVHRAKVLHDLAHKEWHTYKTLYAGKSVSELDMRAKEQAYEDARAAWEIAVNDRKRVDQGVRQLNIRQAEQNVTLLETKIEGLKKELALLYEQRKYYKITTPYDGIIVTDSDTVHAWDNAGTAAAYIHRVERGYYIYSYFEEKDIIHLPNGTKGEFFSNDTGKYYDLVSFDTTRTRTAVGDKVFHLVKFRVLSPVDKGVTMNGAGVVLVKVGK